MLARRERAGPCDRERIERKPFRRFQRCRRNMVEPGGNDVLGEAAGNGRLLSSRTLRFHAAALIVASSRSAFL